MILINYLWDFNSKFIFDSKIQKTCVLQLAHDWTILEQIECLSILFIDI